MAQSRRRAFAIHQKWRHWRARIQPKGLRDLRGKRTKQRVSLRRHGDGDISSLTPTQREQLYAAHSLMLHNLGGSYHRNSRRRSHRILACCSKAIWLAAPTHNHLAEIPDWAVRGPPPRTLSRRYWVKPMAASNATDRTERVELIARDLRAYADAGMEPMFAAKLRAAAEEIERSRGLRKTPPCGPD